MTDGPKKQMCKYLKKDKIEDKYSFYINYYVNQVNYC